MSIPRSTSAFITPSLPLEAIIETLKNVDGHEERRCYAIADTAEHRCNTRYVPRVQKLEEVLKRLHEAEPPFVNDLSEKLTSILLCQDHRKVPQHKSPLNKALKIADAQRPSRKIRRDGKALAEHDLSGPSPLALHGNRRNKAGLHVEQPCLQPSAFDSGPILLSHVCKQLQQEGEYQFCCIAYNARGKRCEWELEGRNMTAARSIVSSVTAENRDMDQDSLEIQSRSFQQLLPLLFCENHLHWFWIDHYRAIWERDATQLTPGDEGSSTKHPHRGVQPIVRIRELEDGNDVVSRLENHQSPSIYSPTPADLSSWNASHSLKIAISSMDQDVPRTPPHTAASQSRATNTQDALSTATSRDASDHFLFDAHTPLFQSPQGNQRCDDSRSISLGVGPPYWSAVATAFVKLDADLDHLTIADPGPMSIPRPRSAVNFDGLGSQNEVIPCRLLHEREAELREALRKPLTKNDEKFHCIYIFKSSKNPNIVKIGRSKTPSRRRCNIGRLCDHGDLREIHVEEMVPHTKRVEKLIHTQLKDLQEIHGCICGTNHREWFRCGPEFAREVVEAWVDWMRREPYDCLLLRAPWPRLVADLERNPFRCGAERLVDVFRRHRAWLEQPEQ